jgi:MinD-like ATPase involved in chromosome partitioning or flagellar assembly
MAASTTTTTGTRQIELTLSHPGGSVRLRAPDDVPLGELVGDFLDCTGQPDGDWILSTDGHNEYPAGQTLAQLEVRDGTRLLLSERTALPESPLDESPERAADPSAVEPETAVAPAVGPDEPAARVGTCVAGGATPTRPQVERFAAELIRQRPLRERTDRVLPAHLSPAARLRTVLAAFAGRRVDHAGERGGPAVAHDPATFTRTVRVSPVERAKRAWRESDYERRLDRLVLAPHLDRCATIAVISPKGGVGKTTITALLGSLLADLRRDRVVAVETNPDHGSLGRRLVPAHRVFIDDLLAGALGKGELAPTQLDAQLGRGPCGLMVAPAPTDPCRSAILDEHAYRTLFARLGELVGMLVLDCGTGLLDPPARAALACADQLVLLCDDMPDTASLVAEAANVTLAAKNTPIVLAVNNMRRHSRIDIAALEREIPFACGVVTIPHDERAADTLHGSQFTWDHAPAGWRTAVRELAALLAAGWRHLDITSKRGES